MKNYHYTFICNGKAPCSGSVGCWYRYHNEDGSEKRDIPVLLQDQGCSHTTDVHYAKNVDLDFEVIDLGDGDIIYYER